MFLVMRPGCPPAWTISWIDIIEIIAECRNAFEAMGILRTEIHDLMFRDMKMPKVTGRDFLEHH